MVEKEKSLEEDFGLYCIECKIYAEDTYHCESLACDLDPHHLIPPKSYRDLFNFYHLGQVYACSQRYEKYKHMNFEK